MARKKIIAGNWKMNMTPSQAVELVNTLKPLVANDNVDVVFCVPAIDIIPAMEAAKGSNISIGAENMYFEEKGAFTGEIAPDMLVDAGVKYVICLLYTSQSLCSTGPEMAAVPSPRQYLNEFCLYIPLSALKGRKNRLQNPN